MGEVHIPIIDEDKLDDIITAIQALSAPSGTDVAISPTGMHIVTEDDVQGAISELDSAVDSVNASLTKFITFINTDTNTTTVASGANATIDHNYTVPTGYKAVAVIDFQLSGSGAGSVSVYNMWLISNGARLQVHNHGTGSISLSSLCRVMCVRSDFA